MSSTSARRFAGSIGATLETMRLRPRGLDIEAEAPAGHVWRANLAHIVVAHNFTDTTAAWQSIEDDMRDGVEFCTNADCEWCNDD